MHVTACLAGQKVDVEVGEECRTLRALQEAIVKELPKLCVEGFDVSVGGCALDDDESVVSMEDGTCLDVVPNTRVLSAAALREAGREVSEAGLLGAAASGNVSMCTLYLDAGVPPDCRDPFGNTPLHHSCSCGFVETTKLLLDRGSAAIEAKDALDRTPLHLSCRYGRLEIVTMLLDRNTAAIDVKESSGHTPLHLSCRDGHLETARLLLDRGSAAVDVKDELDHTPLHLSCCYGHLEIARLLLDRGSAAIDVKEDSGKTPLHLSCRDGRLEIARLLLARGSAAIDEKDREDNTPLQLACRKGHVKVATMLLDHGCAFDVESYAYDELYSPPVLKLLSQRVRGAPAH